MSNEAVARRYARAVFDLGKEGGNLPALSREISAFAEVYEGSEELRNVLDNPLVPEEQREAVLVDIAGRLNVSQIGTSTLRLLARRRRLGAVPEISRQLARLADEDANLVRATVTSAGPVTESYLNDLKAALEKSTGRKVAITHKVDPSLIAGVVTQIGDQVIDGSVRARLASFRESLLRT
ncbi:MAG: ATP synthase F1 subunit delta [Polyangiaceae bacterium]|nr:ATP synthase F1 subunit delta [Polyangiaceae bacterium]NUQ76497.1 ATP synthase F1 subunit delta [Polyangiaceae bacterium]